MAVISIKQYVTGWDYGIYQIPGGVLIDAHAPSDLELSVLSDGVLTVTPVIAEGGRRVAQAFINGSPSALDVPVSVRVHIGDAVFLSFKTNDKTQAWNRWHLLGAEIQSALPKCIKLSGHTHLGDAISILSGVESYVAANRSTPASISGSKLFRDFLDLFDFKGVEYQDSPAEFSDLEAVFTSGSWQDPWLLRFARALSRRFGSIDECVSRIPQLKVPPVVQKEDITLFQLDGRASGTHPLSKLHDIISCYRGSKTAALGGPDTWLYLGPKFVYRTGNLRFLIEQLLSCSLFVGADSGVAHLAGILGVPTHVYPGPCVSIGVVRAFFSSYPTVQVLDVP